MFVAKDFYHKTEYKIEKAEIPAKIVKHIVEYSDEQDQEKELTIVFGLDIRYKIRYIDVVSMGTLTQSDCHPREVYRTAILNNCAAILFAHTHPSGEVSPSPQDIKLTNILVDSGTILGIKMLDHIIVATGKHTDELKYYSFMQMGQINYREVI